MKIQVFVVEIGTMYHVDVSLDHPVSFLKESIAQMTKIPVEKQVMLLSGGVPLFSHKKLGQYQSISDNTVYMVCKSGIPDLLKPLAGSSRHIDMDLMRQLEYSVHLPIASESVRSRWHLAQRVCDIDEIELKEVSQLVYDQHLQQQGWAAVVANLDDLITGFENRARNFFKLFGEFMKIREDLFALLTRMPDVLILLGKIPILPCLESVAARISVSLRGPLEMQPSFSPGNLTLYNWMNAQDSDYDLHSIINEIMNTATQMGEQLEEKVAQEIHEVMRYASGNWPMEMRSIKGLEDRLFSLDKLTSNAQNTLESQVNIRESFRANWSSLEAAKDNSILADLCGLHKRQSMDLLSQHQKMLDLKKKCADAKKELSDNLQQRLVWVMGTHVLVADMDNKLLLHYDSLGRLFSRFEFLRQVEQAPQVYMAMVAEVVRRRHFSQQYMKWAKGVADESKKEYKKEMRCRRSFSKQCGSHFTLKLFSGFNDQVPKFATESPKDMDSQLPDITPSDIANLAQAVPELQHHLRTPTGTGSPALASSTQQRVDGGSDLFIMEVTQSVTSSTASFITQSITSVTQSMAESLDFRNRPLLSSTPELDKLSFSYQVRGDERQQLRLPTDAKAQLFLSMQDKFPVPQCLSETLTAEVNSAAMSTIAVTHVSSSHRVQELSSALEELGQQQQQQQDGGGDGVLLSSGDLEPAKSSDSDAISHESVSEHKSHGKRWRVKGLSDTSPDAETSQEFTTADFYIEDSMPSSITDSPPKAGTSKDQGEIDEVLAEKTKRVGELEGEVSALQSKLAGSEEKLASLQSVMRSDFLSLKDCLAGLKDCVRDKQCQQRQAVCQAQQMVLEQCKRLVEKVVQQHQSVLEEERTSNRLTVQDLQVKLQATSQSLNQLQQASMEKDTASKLLLIDFAKEKEKLHKSLEADKNEALEQMKVTMTEKSRREMEAALQKQREEHAVEMQKELEKLESALQKQREQNATEMQKQLGELESAHQKHVEDREQKLIASHRAETDSIVAEFSNKLSHQKASMQAEFELTLERTKEQAEACIKKCEISEIGIQIEQSVLDGETQTDVFATVTELGIQCEVCSLSNQSVQCQADVSVQGIQTEDLPVCEQGVQSDLLPPVIERETQSEHCPVEERGVQSEAPVACEQGVQSEECDVPLEHYAEQQTYREDTIQQQEQVMLIVRDKEHLIEQLTAQRDQMAALFAAEKDEEYRHRQELLTQLEMIRGKELDLKFEKQQLENEVSLLQHQLRQYSQQFPALTASAGLSSGDAVDSSANTQSTSGETAQAAGLDQASVKEQQPMVQLEEKLMGTSMTSSVRKEVRDKVSILTCNVGDLVLLCLDERHDQYVVFTVGSTLHFLHNDCIDALGLRSAEGELRKNWVLAEVTDREYCQARKAQNRFKVPVNTKFYRVKAKPWNPRH